MDTPLWSAKQVLLLLSALAHLGLLGLVAVRSRRSLANSLFCLFILILAAWILSVFTTSLRLFIPYGSFIAYALAGIAAPTYIAFLLAFAGKRLKPWYALFALPAAFVAAASLSGWVTAGPKDPNLLDQGGNVAFFMPFFVIITMGYLIIAVGFIVWTYWRTTDPFLRRQLRLPLAASIFVVAAGFTIYLVPLLFGWDRLGSYGLFHTLLIAIPAAFAYSMLRYRYMDVAVALRIILVYANGDSSDVRFLPRTILLQYSPLRGVSPLRLAFFPGRRHSSLPAETRRRVSGRSDVLQIQLQL